MSDSPFQVVAENAKALGEHARKSGMCPLVPGMSPPYRRMVCRWFPWMDCGGPLPSEVRLGPFSFGPASISALRLWTTVGLILAAVTAMTLVFQLGIAVIDSLIPESQRITAAGAFFLMEALAVAALFARMHGVHPCSVVEWAKQRNSWALSQPDSGRVHPSSVACMARSLLCVSEPLSKKLEESGTRVLEGDSDAIEDLRLEVGRQRGRFGPTDHLAIAILDTFETWLMLVERSK